MTTNRQFCRFNRGQSTTTGGRDESNVTTKEIPEGGLCLSSFLIVTEETDPKKVLMGHLSPKAEWDHIGALDQNRVQIHSKGWMLPSSHLIIHESPKDAATRVAREQLNLEDLKLSEPKVVSEVYAPKRFQNLAKHWDIEFIFFAVADEKSLGKPNAWTDLQFIDPSTTTRSEFARSHEDVLESAGFLIAA